MKMLTVDELRKVMQGHPELRMHMIPLDKGLVVDETIWLVPTAEGELQAMDLSGIEDIANG